MPATAYGNLPLQRSDFDQTQVSRHLYLIQQSQPQPACGMSLIARSVREEIFPENRSHGGPVTQYIYHSYPVLFLFSCQGALAAAFWAVLLCGSGTGPDIDLLSYMTTRRFVFPQMDYENGGKLLRVGQRRSKKFLTRTIYSYIYTYIVRVNRGRKFFDYFGRAAETAPK